MKDFSKTLFRRLHFFLYLCGIKSYYIVAIIPFVPTTERTPREERINSQPPQSD